MDDADDELAFRALGQVQGHNSIVEARERCRCSSAACRPALAGRFQSVGAVDSTTKSIARPSAGCASGGPTMVTNVPRARTRAADCFWMSPPMTSKTRSTPPTSSSVSWSRSMNSSRAEGAPVWRCGGIGDRLAVGRDADDGAPNLTCELRHHRPAGRIRPHRLRLSTLRACAAMPGEHVHGRAVQAHAVKPEGGEGCATRRATVRAARFPAGRSDEVARLHGSGTRAHRVHVAIHTSVERRTLRCRHRQLARASHIAGGGDDGRRSNIAGQLDRRQFGPASRQVGRCRGCQRPAGRSARLAVPER